MQPLVPIPIFSNRHLILGVTGSIAAYKAADLASRLTQAGALVDVLLSQSAQRFVSPLTFRSVTGRRVYTDDDLWGPDAHVLHIGLAQQADLLAIAPATAHTIAKLATGQADTLLTLTAMAIACPLLISPAMDAGMFDHPATQANLAILRQRGAIIAGPAEGRMASGQVGLGRLLEPAELVGHLRLALGRAGPLAGARIVVTAGGTHEPIDPVRVVANRSSGKQGFALAQAALDRGAAVTIITGPTALETPVGAERIDIHTTAEMSEAVLAASAGADALLMAAAVGDFRPAHPATEKIKRAQGALEIRLEATDDILKKVAAIRKKTKHPAIVVGFAAESRDLVANARAKLEAKSLSLIVANDINAPDAGFAVDTNRVTLIDAYGALQELPLMSKAEVASTILERVVAMLGQVPHMPGM